MTFVVGLTYRPLLPTVVAIASDPLLPIKRVGVGPPVLVSLICVVTVVIIILVIISSFGVPVNQAKGFINVLPAQILVVKVVVVGVGILIFQIVAGQGGFHPETKLAWVCPLQDLLFRVLVLEVFRHHESLICRVVQVGLLIVEDCKHVALLLLQQFLN